MAQGQSLSCTLTSGSDSVDAAAARQEPAASGVRTRLLSGLTLFSDLPKAALGRLADAAVPRIWPVDTVLFQRGDTSGQLFVIESGRVRLSLRTYAGRELVLQIVQGTALVGEVGVLENAPHVADATVISAARGYVIEGRIVSSLMASQPELAQAAVRHLCGLIRNRTDQLEGIALYELDARLSRFFLSALERGDHLTPRSAGRLSLDLSQSEIADMIGCSRPKVNRVLKSLERVGAIRREGRFIVCDRAKLTRVADSITDDVRRMPSSGLG